MNYYSITPPRPKTVVLCFDGTENQFGAKNTNVVRFCSLLDKKCPLDQIVYYQPGIGTYFKPGVVSPVLEWMARWADDLFAWYVHEHIMDGYEFLMRNYREGDSICLFGFSRGAYTARALAAFLDKIGLLPRDNDEQVPFAYRLNCCKDEKGKRLAREFKKAFCSSVIIEFIGVWDTVASIGKLYSRGPSLKEATSGVRVFRHALSLDERRSRFQPSPYIDEPGRPRKSRQPQGPNTVNTQSDHGPEAEATNNSPFTFNDNVSGRQAVLSAEGARHESTSETPIVPGTIETDVLEVWFAGCHSDVGGGAVDSERSAPSLADISLRWMVMQVVRSRCGIVFDRDAFHEAQWLGVPTVPFGREIPTTESSTAEAGPSTSRAPPHPAGDNSEIPLPQESIPFQGQPDFMAGVNDETKIHPLKWFLLEVIPVKYEWQDPNSLEWRHKWGINRWRGRRISGNDPMYHSSVGKRENAVGRRYQPNARLNPGAKPEYTSGRED